MPAVLMFLAGLAMAISAVAIVFVVGLRTKSPLVLRPLIWFSRRFVNPAQMRTAGQPGAYAGIIRVRGRRTRRVIETPVGIVAVDDTFLIATPYGAGAQWLRNVLAAGEAELVWEGHTYRVDRPELVETRDVAQHFSQTDQRLFRLMRTDHCLRLRRVAMVEAEAPLAA